MISQPNLYRKESSKSDLNTGGVPPTMTSKRDVRIVVFTSYLKSSQDVSAFSDGQLVQMGYDRMKKW